MLRRVAPMALRMPISRVRSVTETNMMFITPIAPTNSEMPVTSRPTSSTTPMTLLKVPTSVSSLLIEKSSGSAGRSRADRPHLADHLVLEVGERLPRGRLDRDVDILAPAVAAERLHVGGDRDEDLPVEVGTAEEAAALLLHDADHAELGAADPDATG